MSLESFSAKNPQDNAIQGEKKKLKIALVETEGALEAQARDIAEERLTASKEELKGIKGFFSKIWKHNLAREYYRQREIAKSKAEILDSKNLYVGEESIGEKTHAEAMHAVIERFVQEYEEVIHTDAGETRRRVQTESPEDQQLNTDVRKLVREYASGGIDEEGFHAERNRIIAYSTGLTGEDLASAVHHTDNILEIARQAKLAVEHGASIDSIDQEIEIVVGKAKMGVRTEANMNTVDRIVAKLQSSKLGQFVNETTIASGVAIAYSITVGASQRLASSRAFAWGTFGASALVGGVVAGMRESVKVEEERRQHSRERAKGKVIDEHSERRAEMEQLIYRTVPAKVLLDSLRNIPETIQDESEYLKAMSVLADVESRIQISDREQVDLIAYENFATVEKERLELDIARAKTKVQLRKLATEKTDLIPESKSFDDAFQTYMDLQRGELTHGNEGMTTRDELFKKMKHRKVAHAVTKAVLTGIAIGGVVQEAGAFLNGSRVGLVEHALNSQGAKHTESVTALEGIRRWVSGQEIIDRTLSRSVLLGDIKVELPRGVELTPSSTSSGAFVFTKDGEVLSDSIKFDNGILTPESEKILQENGVSTSKSITNIVETVDGKMSSRNFVDGNQDLFEKINRKFWYNNNTTAFDKNELKLHWGGEKGSGIDATGNYVFNIAKMTPDGSTFKNVSIDAQDVIKEGKMKLLLSLSKDSQSNVVEVPIDAKGNAIIDPNSKIGKLFFKTEGGKLVFTGKFAEVAHEAGVGKNGSKQFEILATHIGKGVEEVPCSSSVVREIPVTTFGVTDTDPYVEPPPFIPLFGRTPLEKLKDPTTEKEPNKKSKHDYFEGGYFGNGLKNKERWESDRSPRLMENPNAQLSQEQEVDWYLKKQNTEYLAEIDNQIQTPENQEVISKVTNNLELVVCMPVAAAHEAENIYNTLKLYSTQDKESLGKTMILMNINWISDADRSKVAETIAEIERAKRDMPDLNIVYFTKEMSREWVESKDKKIFGTIVKRLNDTALRIIQKEGIKRDVHLLTNDADCRGMSKNYFRSFLEGAKRDSKADAFLGKIEWGSESYDQYPGFHVAVRFMQYIDSLYRHSGGSNKNVASSGGNFMCKASIFAAVGGYDEMLGAGADTDLGRRIKSARFGKRDEISEEEYPIRYNNGAWLDTDPSRALKYYKNGIPIIKMWDDWDQGGYQPRGDLGIGEGSSEDLTLNFEKVIQRIEFQISNMISDYVDFNNEKYKEMLDLIFPAREGNEYWILNVDGAGNREIVFTSQGKEWLRSQLLKFETENKKDILYRSRGIRTGLHTTKTKQTRKKTNTTNTSSDSSSNEAPDNAQADNEKEEKERLTRERDEAFSKEKDQTKKGIWEQEKSYFWKEYVANRALGSKSDSIERIDQLKEQNEKSLDALFEQEKQLILSDQWSRDTSFFRTANTISELGRSKQVRLDELLKLNEQRIEQKKEEALLKRLTESFGIEVNIIKTGRWSEYRSFAQETLRMSGISKIVRDTAQGTLNELRKMEQEYVLELSKNERSIIDREFARDEGLITQGRWKREESYLYTIQGRARFQKFDDVLKRDIKRKLAELDTLDMASQRARASSNRRESIQKKNPIERAREILGLDTGATYEVARKAYRRFASAHHPDKNGKTPDEKKISEEKLKDLNEVWPAYEAYLKSQAV